MGIEYRAQDDKTKKDRGDTDLGFNKDVKRE
jgi:hypothetical protein